ncbi:MAG: heavy metal translocating P-type ATPase [Mariprofundaceae bacterium]|nr:heavy metal translocating P-type ATPase [Mariprofundaceae bacterium]
MVMKKEKLTQLTISGMICASCVHHVEEALLGVEGVNAVAVNLAERCAIVHGHVELQKLIVAVEKTGKKAQLLSDHQDDQEDERKSFKISLQRAGAAASLAIALMWVGMSSFLPSFDEAYGQTIWFGIGVLTLCVMFFSGRHFYVSAWQNLKHGISTMDTLISLGTGTAWLGSMAMVISPDLFPTQDQHLYFEAALMIIAFINIGHALEMRARGKTSSAIRSLIGLQARTARLIRQDDEIDIAIKAVQVGDLLRVRPGEKIAVDGVVVSGQSYINEAMISGEPMPILKQQGDVVVAGTMNGEGSLSYRAQHVGSDTTLAKMIQMVRAAQATKPKIGRLADKIASVFVPCVVGIALLTALIWLSVGPDPAWQYALLTSMTVLIIACPCALGLATPISIIVGMGNAAQLGILIRNGEALEKAALLDTIILDKTGTITEGKPTLSDIIATDPDHCLRLAAALEKHSEHPLAHAIVKEAEKKQLKLPDISDFHADTGMGVSAVCRGKTIVIGNQGCMKKHGVKVCDQEKKQFIQLAQEAKTPIFMAEGKSIIAILAVEDPIRGDARQNIQNMQQQGLDVRIFSGDQQATVQAIAQQVGIQHFVAELQPQDKLDKLTSLQQQGKKVAMVGDGMNDAPALAQADVGFAVGSGTDIAIEAADMTLMHHHLLHVLSAIHISQTTIRNIRQNLFAAFIYNILGIPIAAGVLYFSFDLLLSPMLAGAAMAISSLTVVLNANRMRNTS